MIDGLAPYPRYKPSGLSWLREIPSHWDVRRNGRLFAQRNETGNGHLPILEVSLKTGVRVRDLDRSKRKQVMADREKYKTAHAGDIAYNMMRMWQGAVGVAPVSGLVSPAYVVARPLPGTLPTYFAHLFRTPAYMGEVLNYSRGIVMDRNRLYWEGFKQIATPVPPPDEQAAIVRFLAHADGLINRYIAAKQKLIVLLEEERQALVNSAVTRGLGPSLPLKPSGELGLVPEHWEVIRFKQRVGFQEGPGIMADDFRDAGTPLLRISCLHGDQAALTGCNYLDPEMAKKRWAHLAVRRGDYLLSASASTGKVVPATEEVLGAIPYTGILRLWPTSPATHMPFIRLFMEARVFQDQIMLAKSGVGIEHFGPTHLKRMWIALPRLEEQQEIVRSLEEQTRGISNAIRAARRELGLLQELGTRLLSEAVTGKLDVRGFPGGRAPGPLCYHAQSLAGLVDKA